MNLPFKIARRYLFSKKSTNAINIISGISVIGIILCTVALILILSVFNGFGDFIGGLYDAFNPDLKVTPETGKVFVPKEQDLNTIIALEGVTGISKTLEENAMFEYGQNNDFGIIKGVDEYYKTVTAIDTSVMRGSYALKEGSVYYAVLGQGMEGKLSVNVRDAFRPLSVYMPRRTASTSPMSSPLKKKKLVPAGTFAIYQSDFDDQYVLVSLSFVQDLLSYKGGEVSALEIKLDPLVNSAPTISKIKEILGPEYAVKDRYEQDEAFFRIMKLEKWMAYMILTFTLLLVAFNMIGSLWMLVIEKKHDISILKSLGATPNMVRTIFLTEGTMLTFIGLGIGFAIAIVLVLLQQQFGIVALEGGDAFIVQAYPVSMRLADFILIFFTVLFIGLLASVLPAMRAARIPAIVRE